MDPRIEKTRDKVLRATLERLGRSGYGELTIEGVAEQADVAKSTIYRHWPTKLALIADALETLNRQPGPELSASTAVGQVRELVDHLVAAFDDSVLSACIPALIEAAEHHDEVAQFLHTYSAQRRRRLTETIQLGIDHDELPGHLDAELAAIAISGAVIYRRTMTTAPLTRSEGRRLIDMMLTPPTS